MTRKHSNSKNKRKRTPRIRREYATSTVTTYYNFNVNATDSETDAERPPAHLRQCGQRREQEDSSYDSNNNNNREQLKQRDILHQPHLPDDHMRRTVMMALPNVDSGHQHHHQSHHQSQRPQQHSNQSCEYSECGVVCGGGSSMASPRNAPDNTVIGMKGIATEELETGTFDEQMLRFRRLSIRNVNETDLKRGPNRRILVFGGIDPYCQHCQNVEQQQRLLQKQRKHMSFGEAANAYNNTNTNTATGNKLDNSGDQVLIYDASFQQWRHLSYIPFGSRHHHAVVVCKGLIYVIGGTRTASGCTKKSIFEKSVWCFDPQTLKWTLESNMPESRRDFAAVAVEEVRCRRCTANGKRSAHDIGFFIIGGEGVSGASLRSVWFYDVQHKKWTKKASLNVGRYGLTAAMVYNQIWVAGGIIDGRNGDGGGGGGGDGDDNVGNGGTAKDTLHEITDTVEIYSLKCCRRSEACKGEWSDGGGVGAGGDDICSVCSDDCECNIGQWVKSKQRLRVPRLFGRLCKLPDNELVLVGGIGFAGDYALTSLTSIDRFNFEHKQWQHCGDLNWARHGHDVASLDEHSVVVIGGVSTIEQRTLSEVEVFCSKTWKLVEDLPDLPRPLSGSAVLTLD